MDMYVGNATRQIYDFCYKVPELQKTFSQKIHPGTFQKISLDLTKEAIDFIVGNHAKYGLICEDEIDRAKRFSGTCYSIGKPITRTRLIYLMDHNLGELVQQGQQIRNANAIAQNMMVNTALIESGMSERVKAFDMTVQQENTDPANDVPQMSVGMLVTDDHTARPTGKQSRRRAA